MPGRIQVGQRRLSQRRLSRRRLSHRRRLLPVVGGGGEFSGYDDLLGPIDDGLRVVAMVESLVAALDDFRVGVGEVRLRLVGRNWIDRRGLLAET